jgi:hypothetical protein
MGRAYAATVGGVLAQRDAGLTWSRADIVLGTRRPRRPASAFTQLFRRRTALHASFDRELISSKDGETWMARLDHGIALVQRRFVCSYLPGCVSVRRFA